MTELYSTRHRRIYGATKLDNLASANSDRSFGRSSARVKSYGPALHSPNMTDTMDARLGRVLSRLQNLPSMSLPTDYPRPSGSNKLVESTLR